MKISTWIQNLVQYIGDGASRLFKPSDDDYPQTGVQPFSGDRNRDKERDY